MRAGPLGAARIHAARIHPQGDALQPVRRRQTYPSRAVHCGRGGRVRCAGRRRIAACTLELIHTYSLIHDDLPALDNDDLRRGGPTCHKVFGDAMAILAGDALLTLAFQVLAQMDCAPDRKVALIEELATAAGTVGGMIGGQVSRPRGRGPAPQRAPARSASIVPRPVRCSAPACAWAASTRARIDEQLDALSCYGEHVGLAFQIVDDLLDVEQSSEALGKTAGKDAQQHKITFPAVYGLERSREMAEEERLRRAPGTAAFR